MDKIINAVWNQDVASIKQLLSEGSDVNTADEQGATLLHVAIDGAIDGMIQNNREVPYSGALETLKVLLENGASIEIKDKRNEKPLDILNTYSANINSFNNLKNIFRPFIQNIDEKIKYKAK